MFDVGVPEVILILVVALIVFGPGKLPEIGASLGKAIREFRRATQSLSDEIQSTTRIESEDELRTRLLAEQTVTATPAPPPQTPTDTSMPPPQTPS